MREIGVEFKSALGLSRIVPAVKHIDDLAEVLKISGLSLIFLLGGDINTLEQALKLGNRYPQKTILAHIDLMDGIGKDGAGVRYLRRMGLAGILSVKWQLLQFAKENQMLTVQRLFMIDSDALRSGIKVFKKVCPDAIEILPASAPKYAVDEIRKVTDSAILGGGLLRTEKDVRTALNNGLTAVTASRRSIWNLDLT